MMTVTNVKLLELLKESIPGIARVAVVWDPATPLQWPGLFVVETAARALTVCPQPLAVSGPAEYDGAFADMDPGRRRRSDGTFDTSLYRWSKAARGTCDRP